MFAYDKLHYMLNVYYISFFAKMQELSAEIYAAFRRISTKCGVLCRLLTFVHRFFTIVLCFRQRY